MVDRDVEKMETERVGWSGMEKWWGRLEMRQVVCAMRMKPFNPLKDRDVNWLHFAIEV